MSSGNGETIRDNLRPDIEEREKNRTNKHNLPSEEEKLKVNLQIKVDQIKILRKELELSDKRLEETYNKRPQRKYTDGFNIKHNLNNDDFEVTNDLNDGPFKEVMVEGKKVKSYLEEAVNHPQHYRPGTYEAIKVIEVWGLGFNTGNAVKYIARFGVKSKSTPKQDLQKAIWYLQRELSNYE